MKVTASAFAITPTYVSPPDRLMRGYESYADVEKLKDMAESVGLKMTFSADKLFVAILCPDKDEPESYDVLASPLSLNEAWHWFNAYASGRLSVRNREYSQQKDL